MAIVERVKAANVPIDEIVVIGSGLLDAYGLREANDVDLVVSSKLYAQLKADPRFTPEIQHDEEMLVSTGADVYQTWFGTYDELKADAVEIDGVRFSNPQRILDFKKQRNSEKDQRDIALLEAYLNERG